MEKFYQIPPLNEDELKMLALSLMVAGSMNSYTLSDDAKDYITAMHAQLSSPEGSLNMLTLVQKVDPIVMSIPLSK